MTFGRDSVDRVQRYAWKPLDDPGIFMMQPKRALCVNDAYQREANSPKVLNIAREFSWRACGVLIVVIRADGRHEVVDGQHRWLGAMKRDDIEDLPCLVFDGVSAQEAANTFLAVNTNRKPLRMIDRMKALAITGDEAAVNAKRLAEDSGRKIAHHASPQTISCISALMTLAEEDVDALDRVWPAIVDLCAGQPMPNNIVKAAFWLETHATAGCSLSANPWRKRLPAAGYDAVIAAMRRSREYHMNGSARTDGLGMLAALNRRVRTDLFELREGVLA